MCERARPGRAAGAVAGVGMVGCAQESGGVVFSGVRVCASATLGVCIRASTWRDARVFALRVRGPACSPACPGGPACGAQVFEVWVGVAHTFPNVCACVHT